MFRLIRTFSLSTLLILCLFAVSCEDDDGGCPTYFLTKAATDYYTDEFYYNDDGTLNVLIQTIDDWPPRRDEYSAGLTNSNVIEKVFAKNEISR
jgi:hypothetical protein